MATVLLAGNVLTGAGVAVVGATVEVFDRNTTTPVRATFAGGSGASGEWNFTYAPGANARRVDVRVTNGTSISFLKYDDQIQVSSVETANLRIINPAFTFEYDIVPAAITAARQLNLPLITATRTLVANNTPMADNESLLLGTGEDASILYDGTNLVVNPRLVGTGVLDLAAGILELNNALRYDTGVAMVAAAYALGRDADATNQLHLNVPTGATFELSINDVAQMVVGASALTGNVVGTGSSQVAQGSHTTPAATATVAGHVPLPPNNTTTFLRGDMTFATPTGVPRATQAAMEAETNEATYASPDLIKNSPGVAKVWCSISDVGALEAPDYNVSTVTDTGVGDRTVNFSVAFSSAVYSPVTGIDQSGNSVNANYNARATGSVRLTNTDNSNVNADFPHAVAIFGDQ